MSKRQPESTSSQNPLKKPKKNPGFRTAVSSGRNANPPTAREPGPSRLTSISTVVTLTQNEDGRRRGSGQYRNRQECSSMLKDSFPHSDIDVENIPDPTEVFSPTITLESDVTSTATQIPKAKRRRNNNTAVSTSFL